MSEKKNDEQLTRSAQDVLAEVVSREKAEKAEKAQETGKKDTKDKKPKKDKDAQPSGAAKKFKHGTMATVLTAVFIAVLVLVNIVTTMLFDRYPITIDLTKDKIYSVSEESEEYIKNVDTDVLVTVFSDEETYTSYSTYNKQAIELLKNYCKLNHHLSYRFVDIDSNPDVVKNYSDTVAQMDIIFETNNVVDGEKVQRTRKLDLIDLLSFDDEFVSQVTQTYGVGIDEMAEQFGTANFLAYYGAYVTGSNAEQAFTSALMTVTDPNPIYVSFLTGRDEIADVSYFRTLLVANGYNVNEVDITTQPIPEESDILVVAAPGTDYLDSEVQKLSDFLNNDGNLGKQLIYIASYGQQSTPNLDEFLEEYGLAVGPGVICESYSDNFYNFAYDLRTSDVSMSLDQDIESSSITIRSTFTRPVLTLYDEQDMVTTEQYVLSSDNAYTADITYNSQYEIVPGDKLTSGKQCLMAMGSKAKFANDGTANAYYSSVMVFGSESMLSGQYLAADQYDNSEYFMSMLAGITHKTDGIFIKPKTLTGSAFDITEQQKNVLKWTFSLIIPAVVLIIGVVVWIRRKNK